MIARPVRYALPIALLVGLSACSTTPRLDSAFGAAVNEAKAKQVSTSDIGVTAREMKASVATHVNGGQASASALQPMVSD